MARKKEKPAAKAPRASSGGGDDTPATGPARLTVVGEATGIGHCRPEDAPLAEGDE